MQKKSLSLCLYGPFCEFKVKRREEKVYSWNSHMSCVVLKKQHHRRPTNLMITQYYTNKISFRTYIHDFRELFTFIQFSTQNNAIAHCLSNSSNLASRQCLRFRSSLIHLLLNYTKLIRHTSLHGESTFILLHKTNAPRCPHLLPVAVTHSQAPTLPI